MNLEQLESLRNCNELDLLYKLIEIANKSKKRTEEVVRGTKQAGVDVRKSMQDIKMISEIIRDNIQFRKGIKINKLKLEEYISKEQERLKREDEKIKKLEEKRLAQIRNNGE